jgi:hemolysin activation/secretion protein
MLYSRLLHSIVLIGLAVNPSASASSDVSPIPSTTSSSGQTLCVNVKKIEVKGSTSLNLKTLKMIVAKFEHRCLKSDDITQLVREATNQYIESGYITTRVVVPEQNLEDGVLTLEVCEGIVEGLEHSGTNDVSGFSNIFPWMQGSVLNLRDIEQGIDQFGRVKSSKAHVYIKPGSTSGKSILVVENKVDKRWRLETGYNNYGSKSKGRAQGFVNLGYDNAFGLNEQYAFGYTTSLQDPDIRASRAVSSYISIPFGYHNLSTSYNYSHYRSFIFANTKRYKNVGGSRVKQISLESTLHRDGSSKTTSNISLNKESYANFIAGNKIEISSYRMDKQSFGLSHQRRLTSSVIAFGASITKGTNKDYELKFGNFAVPPKNFTKFNFNVSWLKPLPLKLKTITPKLSISLNSQVSRVMLPGTEKIGIGGFTSVRGFKDDIENTDNGYSIRNEFILDLPEPKSRISKVLLGNTELFFAYDFGKFRNFEEKGASSGSISGTAVGFRSSKGVLKIDISLAKALSTTRLQKTPMEFYLSCAFEM